MRESGASRTAIGLFYLLMIPLIAKFAIAPLVDRYPLIASWGTGEAGSLLLSFLSLSALLVWLS